MRFKDFQKINLARNQKAKAFRKCKKWNMSDWTTSLAGEVGEFANIWKKVRRGDFTLDEKREELGKELADVITYADLMMTKLGLDTGKTVIAKFREVSQRIGWDYK